MMLLFLAAASCLLSASCLPTAGHSGDVLEVSMCCPEGQVLKLDLARIDKTGLIPKVVPKCVRPKGTRDSNAIDNLDDATIRVVQPDASETDMVLKNNGVMLPFCPMGLMVKSLPLNNSIRAGMNPSTVWPITQETSSTPGSSSRVKLGDYECGHSNCKKGNVYVDNKPVCDDEWDDKDAQVVCKELGFTGGYATEGSKYGDVDLASRNCWDEVECTGRESSLVECSHRDFDDCSNEEGAGVVCYDDTEEEDGSWKKEKLPYKWVLADDRRLPKDAFATGRDGSANVYSGRVEGSENILGKIHNNEWYTGCCRSDDLRGERHVSSSVSFSVLCVNPEAEVSWVEFKSGNKLPDNVVSGGYLNDEKQYVGRGMAQNELTPGMYVPSKNKLLAMRGGEVHYLRDFELLILKSVQRNKVEENTNVEVDEGYVEEYANETESSPDERIHLTSDGQISVPGTKYFPAVKTYKSGEFCITGLYERDLGPPDEAAALMCHPCQSQVMCMGIMQLFTAIARNDVIQDQGDFTSNIVLVGDMNGDKEVTFEEFKSMIELYVELFFNTLDSNKDGFLDELQKDDPIKNLSLHLVLTALDEVFAFFDRNQDEILSLSDIGSVGEQNPQRKKKLRDILGVSPINLPEPMYRLYTRLDTDKNEEIRLDEATNFIKGIFNVIDQNEDCSINLEEVIFTLKQSKLPKDFQVAVKLLGKYYMTLLDFAVREFVTAADNDGDKKTSLQEIKTLKDPAVIESIFNVAVSMGTPNISTAKFIVGKSRGDGDDKRQSVLEMWLKVLHEVVNNNKFTEVTKGICSAE